jgi:bacterioferritin
MRTGAHDAPVLPAFTWLFHVRSYAGRTFRRQPSSLAVAVVQCMREHFMATTKPFVSDIENIRQRARQDIDKGAMTAGYSADRETVVKLLNHALATELVCVLRYKYHYYMASGINSQAIKSEFLEHANEEQGHADQIAERITQLDGKPNLSPEGLLSRSHSDYVEGEDLVDMIKEDLVAERIAIDSYREMITYIGADDPTTRRVLEGILAVEEEHAEDMNTLLEQLGKKGEPAKPAPAAAMSGKPA